MSLICGICHAEVLPSDIQAHMDAHAGVGHVCVDVWNCQASAVYVRSANDVVYLDEVPGLDEETLIEMGKLAEDSVYDAGGAVNMSGRYPANTALEELAQRIMLSGGSGSRLDEALEA